MTLSRAAVCVCVAAGLALLVLIWSAPDYLTGRGYPLDDAWIHAVYGRSLAREGQLAYNPGVPATGATSPLWSVVVAGAHLPWSGPEQVIATVKHIGWTLHVVTAILTLLALRAAAAITLPVLAGAVLVAVHPDLVSASVSGMEVPLASAFALILLLTVQTGRFLPYVALAFIAPLARPELALLSLTMPVVFYARSNLRTLGLMTSAAALGTAASFGLVAIRNMAVSGRPLVATFYAKAGSGDLSIPAAESMGFDSVLGNLPIADSSLLMCGAMVTAIGMFYSRRVEAGARLAGAAFVTAIMFCAVSFALVRPIDPGALYYQRYVLPVVPLIVASTPVLLSAGLARVLRNPTSRAWAWGALLAMMVLTMVVDGPKRYRQLENDARNIDDIQVALGKSLAAVPSDQSVWAVDAGAVRYFGSPFVVDLLGLNTDPLLGPGAQGFLDRHPPRFIEVVPGWSGLDETSQRRLRGALFTPSTKYTVSGVAGIPMQRHLLMRCDDSSLRGTILVSERRFEFSCAPS
jgi:hypothetical protein